MKMKTKNIATFTIFLRPKSELPPEIKYYIDVLLSFPFVNNYLIVFSWPIIGSKY